MTYKNHSLLRNPQNYFKVQAFYCTEGVNSYSNCLVNLSFIVVRCTQPILSSTTQNDGAHGLMITTTLFCLISVG